MDINPQPTNHQNPDIQNGIENDDIGANLRQKSLRSGLVTFIAQPVKLAIGIGSTAILARLLTPGDFGLVAMVSPLLLFADSLTNLGLETATIKQEKLDQELLNRVFWLALRVNALVIGLMVLLAPMVAWFFQRRELSVIVLVFAMGVFCVCLSSQHQALLKRQMCFGTLTMIEIVALLLAGLTAILAAIWGWGYWALVLQIVVMQLIQSTAYWLFCPWRPGRYQFRVNDSQLQEMLNFGKHLSGFRLLTRVGMHLDRILIGYVGGATALGLYQVAYKWAYFGFEQIYFPLFDVAVSSLSRTYTQPELYRKYCDRALTLLFSLCLPALAFSFVAARDLLLFLLGNQWLEIVPLFQILTIAVFVTSLYRVTKWLYVSSGQTARQFRWGIIYTIIMILSIAIGINWGVNGVAVAYTISACLITYPGVVYCLQKSPLSQANFWATVWRPALAAICAAFVLFLWQRQLLSIQILVLDLLAQFLCFAFTYICLWIFLPGGQQAIMEITKLLCHKNSDKSEDKS